MPDEEQPGLFGRWRSRRPRVDEAGEGNWCDYCITASRRVAHELGLVILATGTPYRIDRLEARRYLIRVPPERAPLCSVQVGRYCEEVRQRKLRPTEVIPSGEHPVSVVPFLSVATLLLGIFAFSHGAGGEAWFRLGRMDSQAIWTQQEWWRILTPLGLHADIGHLAGNLGFGAIFAFFVVKRWGNLVGWSLILSTGVIGNLLLAIGYLQVPHLSVGASTAVMGAIGLLAGGAVRQNRDFQQPKSGLIGPVGISLLGGFALWGFLGLGGDPDDPNQRIDVMAHLWGWLAGLSLGFFFPGGGKPKNR